jgi:type IV pilus assembly protein PilB
VKGARLGDILVKEGVVGPAELAAAEQAARKSGVFLGLALVESGALTDAKFAETISRVAGLPVADLSAIAGDGELAKLVPEAVARRIHCVPLKLAGPVLQVAMANPLDDAAVEQLQFRASRTIKPLVAGPKAIADALKRAYAAPAGGTVVRSEGTDLDRAISGALDDVKVLDAGKEEDKPPVGLEVGSNDPPIIKLVNSILLKAVQSRASDIHIEPQEEGIRVRFRIDGELHPIMELPGSVRQPVASRIKLMSHLRIEERRLPQDGRIKVLLGDRTEVDFRVSILPGVNGEKTVIRILGQGGLKSSVDELGFRDRAGEYVRDALKNPYGMILVTGPTGSGKTTTLYTMLRQLNTGDVNVVTAEDPVEYHLKGIHQVNVKPDIGFTFDAALRSFLRQDPDIILVGEMRDYETAAIAIKAALTGHLVLSTLHTNDAPSTVVRMIDMGIEPYLVASAVKLVIAQRLVRRICDACRAEAELSDSDRSQLRETVVASLERLYRGKGCDACGGIGYRGRVPVFEVLPVRSKEMKRVITEGGTEVQVAQIARREGMVSLRDDVLKLVNDGVTSLEEAYSILLAE